MNYLSTTTGVLTSVHSDLPRAAYMSSRMENSSAVSFDMVPVEYRLSASARHRRGCISAMRDFRSSMIAWSRNASSAMAVLRARKSNAALGNAAPAATPSNDLRKPRLSIGCGDYTPRLVYERKRGAVE